MNEALRDRLAFVSGGASGIGFAIAKALAQGGMRVAIADIDVQALAIALDKLPDALALTLDVRDRGGWEQALDAAESRYGPLAVLVCNAGVAGSRLPIVDTSLEGWEWTRSILLDGVFHGLNLGVPRILAHGGGGHVVATASLGALLVQPGNGAYSAAKAGVVALCEALHGELDKTNVGVSVLLPGLVQSNLLEANSQRAPLGVDLGADEPNARAALLAALDADAVGALVAAAIGTDQFWLFTHPELQPLVAERAQKMADAGATHPDAHRAV